MSKDSINISDFTGVFLKMAEKANINGGKTLDEVEISIFNDIKSTYNKEHKTFIFESQYYDENGNEVHPFVLKHKEEIPQKGYVLADFKEYKSDQKSNDAIKKAKKYKKKSENLYDKPVKIVRNIQGQKVSFVYKRSDIENYIINHAKTSAGQKINHFSKIADIRKKPYKLRSKEECKLLNEFNNMINSAINAGCDYGVDPKLIVSVIQEEVEFDGLSKNATSESFGKGYMQITPIVIDDMLGVYNDTKYLPNLKTEQYGKEIISLFKSRGFNVCCEPSKKPKLADKIYDYIKNNKDADFNIRVGTLLLRYYLKKSKGNKTIALQNYNGVEKNGHKYHYANDIMRIYKQIKNYG